ncbi:MAG: replication-associated recombination protein A [Psychroflexus sp.]|nr:replication-associated recombination protein A [Psychroflexus sp.]MDR9448729.1 replication-associated recombination protein A [Psychroflexus sp.]
MEQPLAERMRPKQLADFIGQQQLLEKNASLYKAMQNGLVPSMILWGPPGVGKTTLAHLIADQAQAKVIKLSAINSGVKDVRAAIDQAERSDNLFNKGKRPVLFIDEIHRFSKSQQDSLLGAVEKGSVQLIGATTENPSFEVISALLSRCQVYILESLSKDELIRIVDQAIAKDVVLSKKKIQIRSYDALLRHSGGDARRLLNLLELACHQQEQDIEITDEKIGDLVKHTAARYDKTGDQHYDIISAFIKSIRGSDPDAAVYWLARMLKGGEDIKFIARRMLILAAEDIGNANPTALVLANTTFQSVQSVGMPEARIILGQCATYLAASEKSNASYLAINEAMAKVDSTGDLNVPVHLRNAPTKLMKELGHGSDYQYPHDHPGNFTQAQYLPDELKERLFYKPSDNGREASLKKRLSQLWQRIKNYS